MEVPTYLRLTKLGILASWGLAQGGQRCYSLFHCSERANSSKACAPRPDGYFWQRILFKPALAGHSRTGALSGAGEVLIDREAVDLIRGQGFPPPMGRRC